MLACVSAVLNYFFLLLFFREFVIACVLSLHLKLLEKIPKFIIMFEPCCFCVKSIRTSSAFAAAAASSALIAATLASWRQRQQTILASSDFLFHSAR